MLPKSGSCRCLAAAVSAECVPVQVLFNMAPKSYTAACTPTDVATIAASVTPPGVTMPDGVTPPGLVS